MIRLNALARILLAAMAGSTQAYRSAPLAARVQPRTVQMRATVADSFGWVPMLRESDMRPNSVASAVAYGQEIAFVANKAGTLYAVANKAPPAGQPLTFSRPTKDGTIKDPVLGTEFDLATGKVVDGTWCSSLLPGAIIRLFLKEPERLATFPVRIRGGKIEAYINKNAAAQYDGQYWKGILDAQGKADGGYY